MMDLLNPVDASTIDPEFLDQLASNFVDIINSLFGVLPPKFDFFYGVMAILGFLLATAKMMWLRSIGPVAEFFKFYVFLMVLLVVSQNWNGIADTWVSWMSRQAFEAVGLNASYLAPSVVLTEGFRIAGRLYESGISFYRIFLGSSDDSIAGLILLISIAVFLWAVIQMITVLVVTMIFFKISSLLALCLLPFVLHSTTRFAAAPGVTRVIQYGVQFWVISLIIGLAFRFMSGVTFSERPTANEVLSFAIGVGVLATLTKAGMGIAKEHIAGTPLLSLREGVHTLKDTARSLNNTSNKLYGAMVNHSRTVGHGGGVGGVASRAFSAMRQVRINGAANRNGSQPTGQPAIGNNTAQQGAPRWAAAARSRRATANQRPTNP